MAITNQKKRRRLHTDNGSRKADPACCNEPDVSSNMDEEKRITHPSISDPVFMHFGCICTIRELVQLQQVCKPFANLVSINAQIATQARKKGNTVDWYFPLLLHIKRPKRDDAEQGVWIDSSTWSALHQSSREVHRLPSLPQFVPDRTELKDVRLLASSGGLVLLTITTRPSHLEETYASQKWRPLVVTNPVTKEWSMLPAPDCRNLGFTEWDYGGSRAHMTVDETTNAYKVILTFRSSLCVYKPASKQWSCSSMDPIPWGIRGQDIDLGPWGFRGQHRLHIGQTYHVNPYVQAASAIVNGKLYYAELEVDNDPLPRSNLPRDMLTHGQVKVYEIDDEVGRWNPGVPHILGNYIPSNGHSHDYGFQIGSYTIGLVECMGSMYAIIPTTLSIYDKIEEDMKKFFDLPSTDKT